jgi:hypothetical protein
MLNDDNTNDGILNFYSWHTDFDSTLVLDECVYPNSYNVKLSFLPKTSEVLLQNNSFDRIKYLFHTLCQNSVITHHSDPLQTVWFKMPVNKVLLPGPPYDQLLARCLFNKIVAISGKYLHIGQLTLDSHLGDNIQYTIDNDSYEDKSLGEAPWKESIGGESWWDRNDTATFDQRLDAKTIWVGARSWRELGYGSDAPKKPFNPTIINGGKN